MRMGPAKVVPADGGKSSASPFAAAFNPNGGYYYGRITFNF